MSLKQELKTILNIKQSNLIQTTCYSDHCQFLVKKINERYLTNSKRYKTHAKKRICRNKIIIKIINASADVLMITGNCKFNHVIIRKVWLSHNKWKIANIKN